MKNAVDTISANGLQLPVLGQGAWHIGERPGKAEEEIAALRRGLELGLNLIDTAEMYGGGSSESLIGRALRDVRREEYILTSKVYPYNAGRKNIFSSCESSLKRLGTDHLDLYLLHWRGSVPLAETVDCMEELVKSGKIRRWGVSNFDTDDMRELWDVPGGSNCAVNQVLYHLGSRGIEYDLIPWMRGHDVAVMAYCPLAQAGSLKPGLLSNAALLDTAKKHGISVMQLLLAFTLRQEGLIAIPKAGSPAHAAENAAAADIRLPAEDWAEIDRAFPAPTRKMPLDMQ
ncbi:aldo/keto reductase [Clostridia bacterium]|nr:aldo/keto reductase [Clostridia bacterium]